MLTADEQTNENTPHAVLIFVPEDGRYLWHSLEQISDFDTADRHTSSDAYCEDWHCDDGSIDATVCGTEGSGCPVTGRGLASFTKKVYIDFASARHRNGLHTNGGLCGLPDYNRAAFEIYVR